MSLPVKASSKQQKHVLWKAQTLPRCKPYNERKGMLKLGKGVLEARLKSERHQRADVNRPSAREHLLETYSVKYEFCAHQIGRMYQNAIGLVSVSPTQVSYENGLIISPCPVFRTADPLSGHRRLCGLVKDHFGGSRKSNQSKWRRS